MKPFLLILGLLAAAPAFSQTKVITNADLGHPLSPNRGRVSPDVLASLAAHQFRLPQTFDGPRVVSSGSSPTDGPFGPFVSTIAPHRLDGSLWTDPPWPSYAYAPGFYPGYALPYGLIGAPTTSRHRTRASRPAPPPSRPPTTRQPSPASARPTPSRPASTTSRPSR